jgi:hypothetical protein
VCDGCDTPTAHPNPPFCSYQGQGALNDGTTITYAVSGKDCTGEVTDGVGSFLEIPIMGDRANIKVPADSQSLSGSYKRDEPLGDYELMEWNLTLQAKLKQATEKPAQGCFERAFCRNVAWDLLLNLASYEYPHSLPQEFGKLRVDLVEVRFEARVSVVQVHQA